MRFTGNPHAELRRTDEQGQPDDPGGRSVRSVGPTQHFLPDVTPQRRTCPSGTTRRGLLAACATATVPTAGCSDRLSGALESPLEVSTDWPRVQYDARATGRTVDVTGPATEPSVRWTTDVEAVRGGTPAVVVADGTVFVASGSVVAALDAADGTERWTTRVSPSRSPGAGIGYL